MITENPRQLSLHPGGLALTRAAAVLAGLKPGNKVLDVGCGTGASLVMLQSEFGVLPFGTDLSGVSVRLAEELHPDIRFFSSDAVSLPFPDRSFDCVLSECVVTLLPDPAAALSEAVRVIRPGGSLILSALIDKRDPGILRNRTAPSGSVSEETKQAGFCRNGLLIPSLLMEQMNSLGMELIVEEDRRYDLVQYLAETILQYGSIAERIRHEQELTGASVFECGQDHDPKSLSYGLYIFRLH